ncbi:MAG: PhoD-like phosphatase N-terminal domain-containing protein [Candidatus Brocadiaceae bacterium]|nr:PhoD-like phosphatase N-terminal domain-containing protein [Candidatus Brocadiaceae bacterium]
MKTDVVAKRLRMFFFPFRAVVIILFFLLFLPFGTLVAEADAVLDFAWSGGVLDSSAVISVKTKDHSGTHNVQAIVSRNVNLSNPVFTSGSVQASSANYYIVKINITGLSASTQYYYGITVDGV